MPENDSSPACGRYAPSPSGRLHLGNLRTALLAWMQARLANGRFLLRIDDLDASRARPQYTRAIIDELTWLGLDWDAAPDNVSDALDTSDASNESNASKVHLQSTRTAQYENAFAQLQQRGALFACYCSRKDIADAVNAPHARARIYPGTCRNAAPRNPSRAPAWRYRIEADDELHFVDELLGAQHCRAARTLGDFVVRRADGVFAYHLANVVDDAQMGVTCIVRGADLVESTAAQLALQRALHLPTPTYWHVPLLCDAAGQRLAKRARETSLDALRDAGQTAPQIIAQLAHSLGWQFGDALSARELLRRFDLTSLRDALRTVH